MPSITGKEVGPVGFGMMGLTLKPPGKTPSNDQSFAAMKAALANGANNWNGGEIYGPPEANSLQLLNAYFTKYPEDADKVVISIKGGCNVGGIMAGAKPNGTPENIKRSIDECLRVLDGKKFLDLFEAARVDPNVPVETTIAAIDEYVKAGKIGGIALSEVSAATIRKAAKVAKISAVEVEFSLWATDILENGVAAACAENDIPIIAYSPIGRGFLTGELQKPEDLAPDDLRRHFPRFQGEAFYENLKLVKEVEKIASAKRCTAGQVALAWIQAHSGAKGLPVIIPIPGASTDKRVNENSKSASIKLSDSEMTEIEDLLKNFKPTGGRYPGDPKAAYLEG
ncbi:putative pyridoxal reductase [Microthyrium microscopicum]|uniref:Putative pyridoxal reductase n=1 Tax=Microthyrium microscopicum TaxID=703497 RepID=A0A6A6U5E8_9PEZI|nr:putative pyridoxal reductase [Microthyrium microscopicum]